MESDPGGGVLSRMPLVADSVLYVRSTLSVGIHAQVRD